MTSTTHRPILGLPRLLLSIAVVLATIAAGVGVLSATAQGEDVIYGCVHQNSGSLRIVGEPGACKNNENVLTWSAGGTTATVHWDDIEGIPPGVEDPVAQDVQCDGCVGSADIENVSVQSDDLSEGSVTTAKLVDGNVTTDKLADGSVTTGKLDNDSVTADQLAANSVDSTAIQDGSITSDDLGNDSITTFKIRDGEIFAADLAERSVTEVKLADDSVNGDKLAENAVTTSHVQDGSITSADIADGTVTSQDIDANAASGSPTAILTISDSELATHLVLVSADAKVECIENAIAPAGCNGTITWQLWDDNTPEGTPRSLRIALTDGEEMQITAQDIVSASHGMHEYRLFLTYTSTDGSNILMTEHVVAAVDLGRN